MYESSLPQLAVCSFPLSKLYYATYLQPARRLSIIFTFPLNTIAATLESTVESEGGRESFRQLLQVEQGRELALTERARSCVGSIIDPFLLAKKERGRKNRKRKDFRKDRLAETAHGIFPCLRQQVNTALEQLQDTSYTCRFNQQAMYLFFIQVIFLPELMIPEKSQLGSSGTNREIIFVIKLYSRKRSSFAEQPEFEWNQFWPRLLRQLGSQLWPGCRGNVGADFAYIMNLAACYMGSFNSNICRGTRTYYFFPFFSVATGCLFSFSFGPLSRLLSKRNVRHEPDTTVVVKGGSRAAWGGRSGG